MLHIRAPILINFKVSVYRMYCLPLYEDDFHHEVLSRGKCIKILGVIIKVNWAMAFIRHDSEITQSWIKEDVSFEWTSVTLGILEWKLNARNSPSRTFALIRSSYYLLLIRSKPLFSSLYIHRLQLRRCFFALTKPHRRLTWEHSRTLLNGEQKRRVTCPEVPRCNINVRPEILEWFHVCSFVYTLHAGRNIRLWNRFTKEVLFR